MNPDTTPFLEFVRHYGPGFCVGVFCAMCALCIFTYFILPFLDRDEK